MNALYFCKMPTRYHRYHSAIVQLIILIAVKEKERILLSCWCFYGLNIRFLNETMMN